MIKQMLLTLVLSWVPIAVLAADPLVLITEKEARLPAGDPPKYRGITRGPTLEVLSPRPGANGAKGLVNFKVRFVPHGGATIDPESVQVTYVKSPSVDLTERLEAYISEDGIDAGKAIVPPGEHLVEVSVLDSSGRRSSVLTKFSVR